MKVSIGMPVYNGEPFLREAIEAILAQSFADFELIISDNASTDATEKICRSYASKDERIRYYRLGQNIGAAGNFNRVFNLSTGEYFKWAAHDDLHGVDYLKKCVQILDSDRWVVLCHSQVQIIDEQGQFLQNYNIRLNTNLSSPTKRFHELLTQHLCYQIFGLIRASSLKKTSLMGNYGHADGVLLAKIGLQGRFYEIPEPLFLARSHSQQSMSLFFPEYLTLASGNSVFSEEKLPDYYAYAVWFNPNRKNKILFPHWRIFWEYWLCVRQASLSILERISCYFSMFEQLRGMKFLLIKDLIVALSNIKALFTNFRQNLKQDNLAS
jgi:glycosyltransferase involved in cell wall biosynthesis